MKISLERKYQYHMEIITVVIDDYNFSFNVNQTSFNSLSYNEKKIVLKYLTNSCLKLAYSKYYQVFEELIIAKLMKMKLDCNYTHFFLVPISNNNGIKEIFLLNGYLLTLTKEGKSIKCTEEDGKLIFMINIDEFMSLSKRAQNITIRIALSHYEKLIFNKNDIDKFLNKILELIEIEF